MGDPKTTPPGLGLTRRTDRTQPIVILKALVDYSEKMQSRTSKGKGP